MLVSMVQPVIILNALFCVIYSFCMLVSETTGDQMVLAYSIASKIRGLYVTSRLSFCFPQCYAVRALRILVARSAFFGYFDVFTEIECRI